MCERCEATGPPHTRWLDSSRLLGQGQRRFRFDTDRTTTRSNLDCATPRVTMLLRCWTRLSARWSQYHNWRPQPYHCKANKMLRYGQRADIAVNALWLNVCLGGDAQIVLADVMPDEIVLPQCLPAEVHTCERVEEVSGVA